MIFFSQYFIFNRTREPEAKLRYDYCKVYLIQPQYRRNTRSAGSREDAQTPHALFPPVCQTFTPTQSPHCPLRNRLPPLPVFLPRKTQYNCSKRTKVND